MIIPGLFLFRGTAARTAAMTQEMIRAEPAEATLHTVLPPRDGVPRVEGGILLDLPEPGHFRYQRVLKPVIDVVGAVVLVLLTLPVIVAVAVSVRISLGSGVIYRQERVGRGGRRFMIYKFRTMHADRRKATIPFDGPDRRVCHKTDNDPRHTSLGRLLRRYSLDELPQLWNILLGDMSLVGPRPELLEVVARFEPWQQERHRVKPGLTGLWQVTCRGEGLAHENVELDLEYINSLSLLTDLKILALTVPVALFGSGGK
jgi:lipopolysaccharide/colanic/teichoic acid biosynthesis glycosyltransferase